MLCEVINLLISIVWALAGAYFMYLGIIIVFLKKYDKIPSLQTHLYKNKEAFALRVGLIELISGLLILGVSIVAAINYKNILFSYTLFNAERQMGYALLPLVAGMLAVLALWINQKASEVKASKPKKDEEKTDIK